MPDFIALDLETTGLSSTRDRIVEIGAVKFTPSGEVLATFSSLVNPGMPCSPKAAQVHGISDDVLASAPDPLAVRSFSGLARVSLTERWVMQRRCGGCGVS